MTTNTVSGGLAWDFLDVLPVPLTPTHKILDASKLKVFMTCPRQFFYEYVLGWRSERPNNHLIFGEAWHRAMEHLLLNGYGPDSIYDAYCLFEEKYRKTFTSDTDDLFFPKTPARAFEALGMYAGRWANDHDQYEILLTEVAGKVSILLDVMMHFRMDSVLKNLESGKIESFEHKTGSSLNHQWQNQWELEMQPNLYTHVLYCHYAPENVEGVTVNGTFFLKNKGTRGGQKFDFCRVPVMKSKSQMQAWYTNTVWWIVLLKRQYEVLAESKPDYPTLNCFPMNTTACNKFFGCIFQSFCSAWANPLQRAEQPPPGFKVEFWDPSAREAKVQWEL